MSKEIIARTNTGGDISHAPITITRDHMESIEEGEILTINIPNSKTMSDILVAGTINNLVPVNETEDRNKPFIEYTRSRSNEIGDNDGYALEEKLKATTYFNADFKVFSCLEINQFTGPRTLQSLPRPILPGQIVTDSVEFLETLESTLDSNKYAKFGRIPSKKIKGGHDNLILKPDFDISARHIGIFADTSQGKSTVWANMLTIYSETEINIMGVDPKSQIFNESLASGRNFLEKLKANGRTIYNLSIFDDIYIDLDIESFSEFAKVFKTFNDRVTWNFGNKHKFIKEFGMILLKDYKDIFQSDDEIDRETVLSILNEFKKESLASRVYSNMTSNKAVDKFIENIEELTKDNYRVASITNNLNELGKLFSKNENKWTIQDINDEFLHRKSGNKSVILIHPGTEHEISQHYQESHLAYIVSKIINAQKQTLSKSNFDKANALFFADEADLYFPKKTKSQHQQNAVIDLRELLSNWARSKGLGFALICPDPSKLDEEIFERIIHKTLLVGFGLKQSVINDISKKLTPELSKEFQGLNPLESDHKELMEKCEFFAVGLKSALDPSGLGMLVEFRPEDFDV